MLKNIDFEKMPTKDPQNEKQREYYLDYLLKKKAEMQVLTDESEKKCLELQAQLHENELVLRVRMKNLKQFEEEQERIRNFVIPSEEPKTEKETLLAPKPEIPALLKTDDELLKEELSKKGISIKDLLAELQKND